MPLLIALLIVVPLIELYVILQVADLIGGFPTVVLLLLVSIVGSWLLKQQGTATWRRMRATMNRGEMPTDEATDGALILLGGALLLTPGFVTDIVGLGFLIPASRRVVKSGARRFLGRVARRRFGSTAGRRMIYDAGVTSVRRKKAGPTPGSDPSPRPPEQLPSAERPSDEDDSPDRA